MIQKIGEEDIQSIDESEIASVEESPDTGPVEAALRSAAQGLSFDLADEITAVAEQALTGKSYDQALKESRAEYEANQKEYPITSLLGGLAGGIGQAALVGGFTGGAGAAGSVAGTASKLSKLKDLVRGVYFPSAGKSALQNIGSAAKTSAIMGGLTGIGASEKEGLKRLEDVPMAAGTSAILGGALGGLVEGGKFVGGAAFDKLKELAKEGKLPYSGKKILDVMESSKEKVFTSRKEDTGEDIAKMFGTSIPELEELNPKLKGKLSEKLPENLEIKVPGQGYVQQRTSEAVDAQLEDASEVIVKEVQNALDQARELKSQIVANVPDKQVPMAIPVLQGLVNELSDLSAQRGFDDAIPVVKFIQTRLNSLAEEGGINLVKLNSLIQDIGSEIEKNKKSKIRSEVQAPLIKANNVLKTILRGNISREEVADALRNLPDVASNYKTLIGALPESQYEKNLQAQVMEQQDIDKFFKDLAEPSAKRKPSKTQEATLNKILADAEDERLFSQIPDELLESVKPVLKKIKKNEEDVTMEDLRVLNDFVRILDESGKTKLTKADVYGDSNLIDYLSQSVKKTKKIKKDLQKSKIQKEFTPEEIQQIEESYKEVLESSFIPEMKQSSIGSPISNIDTFMSNVLEGSESLGKITRGRSPQKNIFKVLDTLRGKETDSGTGQKALISYRNFIESMEKTNTELATKIKNAVEPAVMSLENQRFFEGSKLGESPREVGVLRKFLGMPAQVTAGIGSLAVKAKAPRLGVSTLKYMKDSVDEKLKKAPNSLSLLSFSKFLDNALETQDEGRRAAILNTLNQYKEFRELFRDEESEQK